jgi:hypothetical protein
MYFCEAESLVCSCAYASSSWSWATGAYLGVLREPLRYRRRTTMGKSGMMKQAVLT